VKLKLIVFGSTVFFFAKKVTDFRGRSGVPFILLGQDVYLGLNKQKAG
jgi:hypothetical protein